MPDFISIQVLPLQIGGSEQRVSTDHLIIIICSLFYNVTSGLFTMQSMKCVAYYIILYNGFQSHNASSWFKCYNCYEGRIILMHSRTTQIPTLTPRISKNNTIKYCIIPAITKSECACFIPENYYRNRNQQRHWKTKPHLCNPLILCFTTSLLTLSTFSCPLCSTVLPCLYRFTLLFHFNLLTVNMTYKMLFQGRILKFVITFLTNLIISKLHPMLDEADILILQWTLTITLPSCVQQMYHTKRHKIICVLMSSEVMQLKSC
jgi:hypothetical protein